MDFQQGFDRNQLMMMDLNSMVSSNSWARIVDLFVDFLPLKELAFEDYLAKEGRPPYHCSDVLKLYLYGYKNSIRSSRKLAQACHINLEVIWLLKGLKPSARTIAYFRKNNANAIKNAFRYFVVTLKEWELIDGEMIAIDSFKIRAQNASKNNFNQKKINRHIDYIDAKIETYNQQLDHADTQEDAKVLEDKIAYQESKKKKFETLENRLSESKDTQISLTDPDSRSVILTRNIINVGYCVQAGCDAKHKLFINNDTGSVNDTHALSSMALDAKELLGVNTMDVLTDKGYTTGKHIAICSENNIITYSSPKAHSSQKNGLYDMQTFDYNENQDHYTCPNNQVLKTNGSIYKKGKHQVKHYKNHKACKSCPIRDKCTKNKMGRIIERSIYHEALEQNQERVDNHPEYYRLRQQITEHQFGTLKRQWGFTFTLMKGKENVLTEVNLEMICYNLRRILSIYGPNALKNRLKSLWLYTFACLDPIKANLHASFYLYKKREAVLI